MTKRSEHSVAADKGILAAELFNQKTDGMDPAEILVALRAFINAVDLKLPQHVNNQIVRATSSAIDAVGAYRNQL